MPNESNQTPEIATHPKPENHCPAVKASEKKYAQALAILDGRTRKPMPLHTVDVVANPLDLNSLRYREIEYSDKTGKPKRMLTPDNVSALIARINDPEFIAKVVSGNKPFVLGIATGGTICMSKNTEGRLEADPDTSFQNIVNRASTSIANDYIVEGLDAYSMDSSELTINDEGDMVIAMNVIYDQMDDRLKEHFAGFLITHGTDTMPNSGAHMIAMEGANMQYNVVHTGAQKPIGQRNNDAEKNVQDSLLMLDMLKRHGCAEAVTVMGRVANLTSGITKVDDTADEAMYAYMHEQVINFSHGVDPDADPLPNWLRKKNRNAPADVVVYRGPDRTAETRAKMQTDDIGLRAAIRHGRELAHFVISYGAGTFDPRIADIIGDEIAKKGIPLFAFGPAHNVPMIGKYAAGPLENAGATPVGMTKEMGAARVMRAAAQHYRESDVQKDGSMPKHVSDLIRSELVRNLAGEIPQKGINQRETGKRDK